MSLDHGMLNVPLAKRGDIDAQIDKYLAKHAAEAKAAAKAKAAETTALRARAKAIVAAMTDERIAELAAKCEATPAAIRKLMTSNAHWHPALVIKAHGGAA